MSDKERHDEELDAESQQPDEQDKTTMERVDKQKVETKTVTPDKRGDVQPKE